MRLLDRLRGLHNAGPHPGVVLLYHRIAAGQVDPYALCVTPEHFEQQMAVLAAKYQPVSLDVFAESMKQGTLEPRSVAVTFDDGYIDNFETAGPILKRHGIDATVFVVSGPGGRTHEFWWDDLERIFLQPGTLPDRLELGHEGRTLAWELGESADYDQQQAAAYASWHLPWGDIPAEQADTPTPRHKAFREVYLLMQPMSAEQQARTLDNLRAWAGADAVVRDTHRAVELDELAATSAGLPLQFGAHTIDHAAMTSLNPGRQREQLAGSRDALAQVLGRPVTTASYPYGLYDRSSIIAARKAGLDCVFACGDRAVAGKTNRYAVPRLQVPDIDGDRFGTLLDEAFAASSSTEGRH